MVLVVWLALAPAVPTTAQDDAAQNGDSEGGVAYVTTIDETGNQALDQALRDGSNLLALQETSLPAGLPGLLRRATTDVGRLEDVLRAYGYYDGIVSVRLDGRPLDDIYWVETAEPPAGPVQVTVEVEAGTLYTLSLIDLVDARDGSEVLPVTIDRQALGIAVGDPARSEPLRIARARLVDQMEHQGYPFADVPVLQAMVDHATRTMEVAYALEPGPLADFGTVQWQGLERMDQDFLARLVPFTPGERYDPDALETLRTRLRDLRVFESVLVESADTLESDGRLPITIAVGERPPRFIGFGATYSTSEGIGVLARWGHRNLFGGAERLELTAGIGRLLENAPSDIDYRLRADFLAPDAFLLDQDIVASAEAVQENPDAFSRTAIVLGAGIEQEISDILTVGAGLSAEFSEIEEDEDTAPKERFTLIGVPLTLRLDTTDNLLDPTEGFRVAAAVTPYPTFLGSSRGFVRTQTTGSTYYDVIGDGRLVLAGRATVGVISGQSVGDVPADKRFYAGGGGSIRGFAYQAVGPRDAAGNPSGGLSLFEFSAEARIKITEDIGIVPFLDGGNVFETEFPTFDEPLRYGAGLGARYYTSFGPIRVDFAVPLERREDDDAFQIYVSVGQAF